MINPVTKKFKVKNKALTYSLLSVITVFFISFLIFTIIIFSNKKIYNGVYVNDINMGKMTYSQAYDILKSNFTEKIDEVEITLIKDDFSKQFDLSEFNVLYDVENAVNKAYEVGREGHVFKRFKDIIDTRKNGVVFDLEFSFNEEKLMDSIENFYDDSLIEVQNPDIIEDKNTMYFYTGKPGVALIKDKAFEHIHNSIKTVSSETFEVPTETTMPDYVNLDNMYNEISREAKNAHVIVEDNEVVVMPHVIGRKINKSELEKIIENNKDTYDVKKDLPVSFVKPEIKTENIDDYLFRDILGTHSTYFSTSTQNDANRGVNIGLSSSKIDGTILGPGDVFSFNDIVGPRTSERGYLSANIYVQGEIVPGVGGGICQVSSTLYNAVLFSGLETVYRMNHMFTVGYVPYGQDAAVSYNELDFKFKNNTNWPIRIDADISNNNIGFEIVGTNETPEKSIEIVNVQISSTPATVKYIDDPNMYEGETVIIQSGKSGYVYDTYKVVKIDGVETERTYLHRSSYRPYDQIVKRGTKPVESSSDEDDDDDSEISIDESEIVEIPEDTIPASEEIENSIDNN
ncbi:VanW family protein [Herbivorax sp. ANBcel31]|uniref:VanW family protein n=1 Tax=Herbivorax sp. ANBcel31 TaxID=3069754 RepID=UPI0027ADAF57|nr:VanW family protein [Herbivorax sp. ANBcel31]MDQ2086030.1 VanW family protein [Herbivorax sp. ANBcel31]